MLIFFFSFLAQFVAASGVKSINQHTLRANNIVGQGGGTPFQVLGIQRPRGISTTPVSTKQINSRGIVTPQQQHRHMINAAGALRIATPTGMWKFF